MFKKRFVDLLFLRIFYVYLVLFRKKIVVFISMLCVHTQKHTLLYYMHYIYTGIVPIKNNRIIYTWIENYAYRVSECSASDQSITHWHFCLGSVCSNCALWKVFHKIYTDYFLYSIIYYDFAVQKLWDNSNCITVCCSKIVKLEITKIP